ncbi:MAG: hypothetical protein ACOZAR_01115 [Patescibacteria group bacterium]
MKGLFEKYLCEDVGIDKDYTKRITGRFIDKKRFESSNLQHLLMTPHHGAYYSFLNKKNIHLNPIAFFERGLIGDIARDLGNDKLKKLIDDSILRILIHEETHAVSHDIYQTEEQLGRENTHSLGYNIITINRKKLGVVEFLFSKSENMLINEGITDLIADKIADKYYLNNNMEIPPRENTNKLIYMITGHGYISTKEIINELIDEISDECQIDKKVIWDRLVRDYFGGLEGKKQIIETLLSCFSQDFLKKFIKISNENNLRKLIRNYLMKNKPMVEWNDEKRKK